MNIGNKNNTFDPIPTLGGELIVFPFFARGLVNIEGDVWDVTISFNSTVFQNPGSESPLFCENFIKSLSNNWLMKFVESISQLPASYMYKKKD